MRFIKTFIIILLPIHCLAQYPQDLKADYTWIFGYGSNPALRYGNSILQFNGSSFDTTYKDAKAESYLCNSAYSDSSGKLLVFSQGFCAYDSALQKIPGSDSMNCCNIVFQWNYNKGYPNIDGVLIIKQPGYDNKYIILHKPSEIGMTYHLALSLRQTVVQQQPNDFISLIKDDILFTDSIGAVGIEACRHANGRDWWLIQKHQKQNKHWVFLIDPNGVNLVNTYEHSGYVPPYFTQSVFTPDGGKYIIAGMYNAFYDSLFIVMYDFDRCSGTLSNPQYHYWKEDSIIWSSGCAVSPNSKYLYVSATDRVYQFDISSPNWKNTKTLVAMYDGFADTINGDPWPTSFFSMQLAPDSKIYLTAGATHYLHTIVQPDVQGIGCNLNQHSLKMPSVNARTMPNFPNYRLGPIDGSPCDTLGIDNLTNINDKLDNNSEPVKLFPNPATDYITLFVPRITKAWEFALYDIQGRELLHINSRGAFRSIDISHLQAGMYLWKLVYEDGKVENGKMVKQ